MSGTLTVGLQEAIVGPAQQRAEDFKNSVDVWKGVTGGVIGTGIGVGTVRGHPGRGHWPVRNRARHGRTAMEKDSAYTEKAAELAAQAYHGGTDVLFMAPRPKTEVEG
ncbi:hypothetical protein [Streptomyces fragilis]|uniref:Uncharacterized protein n=1 Tax=Streptomyces fragilis TaxID=67301 RepID=A0ABV2YKA6_9ACTN|nr:hypothetical protein [Streptomyces fragilis]